MAVALLTLAPWEKGHYEGLILAVYYAN
jgi:hypothetical protein